MLPNQSDLGEFLSGKALDGALGFLEVDVTRLVVIDDGDDSVSVFALEMLYSYACMIPNVIAYDIYKPLIIELSKSADPLHRKAGLKILGFVCDSDGLLDPIKNDIDLWTDLIVESFFD